MESHEFMLTVEAGKRLIARGLLADAQFRRALYEKKVLIVAGTTNGYVAEAALHALGEAHPFDRQAFRRGVTVAPGAKLPDGTMEGDLLIDHGRAVFGRTVFEVAPELSAGDVILKGANAVNLPLGEAGVLIGHPQGGTMIPITAATIGRRVQVIVPVGLEKRVDAPIARLSALCANEEGTGPRLAPLAGRVFTELDAIAALTGARAELIAAGGVLGAEGCAYLLATGTDEQLAALKQILRDAE